MAHSAYGSLTLFENDKILKTIFLQGYYPIVRVINGDVVSATRNGKLTVLNNNLEVLRVLDDTHRGVVSLAGNDKFISFGDWNGTVHYYNRENDFARTVSVVYE